MKSLIIPAVMPERFDDVANHAVIVRRHASLLQIDLMDGKYVPEKTWPFFYVQDYDFQDLQKEDSGLPYWEDINYELDLMVQKPEDQLDQWLSIGASRIVFHYASVADWEPIFAIDHVIRNFTQIGLGVTIHDDLDNVMQMIASGHFDYVQVMGIAHIGYQGEPFDDSCLAVITSIRKEFPELLITIDGGVSIDTVLALQESGVNQFVSGSGVFGGGDAVENIQGFEGMLGLSRSED